MPRISASQIVDASALLPSAILKQLSFAGAALKNPALNGGREHDGDGWSRAWSRA
jgi:hypothetical protein